MPNKQSLAGHQKGAGTASAKHAENQLRGKRIRQAGEYFENLLSVSCEMYRLHGAALIEKTPEPMRPLSRPNSKGQFMACYTKAAQPDYKGTLDCGQAIVFEAKHTDDDRISQQRVTPEQAAALDQHHKLGALTYVVVSMGMRDFYRIPWPVWRDMGDTYGHMYMTQEDMEPYRLPAAVGYIRILDGLAEERSNHRG